MNEGIKITQLRLPAELHEAVKEQAHEKRQSRNQFMVEGIKDKVANEAAKRLDG